MRTFYFFLLFSFANPIYYVSQSLQNFTWNHRLLLMITDGNENTMLAKQLAIFAKQPEQLAERKIKIVKIEPTSFQIIGENKIYFNKTYFKDYNIESHSFKVVLIGLDGREKFSQTEMISLKKLFTLIDQMPMRQTEIKTKRK